MLRRRRVLGPGNYRRGAVRRRGAWWIGLCLCLVSAVLSTGGQVPAAGDPNGMVWGAYVSPRTGESEQTAVQRMERDTGREMGVVREFVQWDEAFPDSYHRWLRDSNRTIILSVKSNRMGGSVVPWASIAAAVPGSTLHTEIERWADRMKALGVPAYFAFNHEPEAGTNLSKGTAADFIAAWRKIRGVFRSREVTNTKFIWIMTDYSFFVGSQDRRDAAKWYPGDDYVDAMGADAYNWYNCREGIDTAWWSLERIITPFRDFGAAHPEEELWLPEWASAEDPANPTREAEWINQARALFKRPDFAQFKGVAHFDRSHGPGCQWFADSSPASLAAFRAMGQDAFYGGPATPPPPDPDPTSISFVASASRNSNVTNHSVQVPADVREGDALLLFFSANSNPATTSPPAGWTQVHAVDPSGMRGRAWRRTATAADAGSTVVVRNSSITKADLLVAAYRGLAASAIDVSASAVDTTSRSVHLAPSVTPTQSNGWVVTYWADKSDQNVNHTIPATLARRRTTSGTSGGHITATLADTSAAVSATPTGTFAATGTATATKAVMYTIALRP